MVWTVLKMSEVSQSIAVVVSPCDAGGEPWLWLDIVKRSLSDLYYIAFPKS
jgi:hypothetical protein